MTHVDGHWREEFLRLFGSMRSEDVRAAFDLKRKNLPTRVYKFFSPTDHAYQGLADGTVWLASPATCNDPFDSSFILDTLALFADQVRRTDFSQLEGTSNLGISADEMALLVLGQGEESLVERLVQNAPAVDRDNLRQLVKVLPQMMERVVNQSVADRLQLLFQHGLKIASFTERATSLLLWAHYAGAHSGFCVEYAPAEFLPGQQRLLFPVFYSSKRFDLSPLLRSFAEGKVEVPNHAILAALHKSEEWTYEQEWRVINPDGRVIPGFPIQVTKPRAVYAGLRMSDADKRRLAALCSAQSIPLRDVTLSRDRYEVYVPSTDTG